MNSHLSAGAPAVAELTLLDVLLILRRRRHIVIVICLVCLALALVKSIFGTRRYEAVASIQIQKEDADSLGIETALGSAAEGASDALDYNITLQTQARILSSDTLALAVIQQTDLESNADFNGKNAWIHIPARLTPWNQVEPEAASVLLEASPGRRRRALKTFARHLKIDIVPGTRIINISFLSTDPNTASAVVNCLIRQFTEYNYKTRFAATAQVSDWLATQLHGLQVKAGLAQARKVRLQTETGLFGDDEGHNVVLARLEELSSGLTRAESDRMLAQSLDRVTSTGDPDLIEALGFSSSAVGSGSTAASLALLQQLRARQSEAKAQLSQSLAKFGPNYPMVVEQQAQLQSVQKSVSEEIRRITASAHRQFQVAEQVENASRQSVTKQKALMSALGKPTFDYTMAKQEADSSRDLYEGLSTKLTAASVLSGLQSTNVTVIDPGRAPAHNHPKQPDVQVTLLAGCLGGLLLGGVVAFASDFRDTRLYSVAQIEQLLGVPPLAILPVFKQEPALPSLSHVRLHRKPWPRGLSRARIAVEEGARSAATPVTPALTPASLDPESNYAEALRSLRTSLMLSRSQGHPKVILITSALPGEGKSTTALNFATILGQQGGRVLIVDGDLRRPTLHRKLRIGNTEGLSSLLSLEESHEALRSLPGPEDIWILTTGPRPPYPAELLGSVRMDELLEHWRANFDFILIDSPPVLPVTDAVLLSGRVDAILMVARYRMSTRSAVTRAYRMLVHHAGEGKVSVVLNGVGAGLRRLRRILWLRIFL